VGSSSVVDPRCRYCSIMGDCFCRKIATTVSSLLRVLVWARGYCGKGMLEFMQVSTVNWIVDGREKC